MGGRRCDCAFSTIYSACEKSIASVMEGVKIETVKIELEYPVEDEVIVRRLREAIKRVIRERKRAKLAIFDTVLTFPGARVPWESFVSVCKELEVLSLIDGAHGIDHIDLTHLGKVGLDFFVSNCYKWLYSPRGCAVFHVPYLNQNLIRTSIPTSHGYQYPSEETGLDAKSPFVHLFEFVVTIDYTPYACIPAALEFRRKVCDGEAVIRNYCYSIARVRGKRVAEILGTEVMNSETKFMSRCCFTDVAFSFSFKKEGELLSDVTFDMNEVSRIARWINLTAVKEYDAYLQVAFHAGRMWVRLSGQIYLEVKDFEWVGHRLKELSKRIERGEFKKS